MKDGTSSFAWPSAHELATCALIRERDEYEAEMDIGRDVPEVDAPDAALEVRLDAALVEAAL